MARRKALSGGVLLKTMRVWMGASVAMLAIGTVTARPDISPPIAHELTRTDLQAWLDGFLPYSLEQNDIAGAVVLVVKDGQVLFQKGYGYADLHKHVPMDPQTTVVGVGSVSKLFTWTAVMQLVEQGKLDLDRDVNAYLDFTLPEVFAKPITLRHLMTHTAGFAERLKEFAPVGSGKHSLREYMRDVPPPKEIFPPGEVPAYSNYGTDLAGYIVERVSGERFEAYVSEHILEPLGMTRSAFCKPVPPHLAPLLAQSYRTASSDDPVPPEANTSDPRCAPSGDLVSTASDMSHFMLAHLQRGRYGDFQLLQPSTAEQMHTTTFVPFPGAQGTALGFFHGDYDGHQVILHDGDLTGFHTDLELLPDDGVGFFLSVNSDGTGGLIGAAYSLRSSLSHAFLNRYFPPIPRKEEPTTSTAKAHAALVAGEYEMSRRASGTFMEAFYLGLRIPIVANPDGTITTPAVLSFRTGRPQTWREIAPFVWREVGGDDRLNMQVQDGRVRAWVPRSLTGFVMQPVSPLRSAALNIPLFIGAISIVLLTSLAWPVVAFVRRRGRRDSRCDYADGRSVLDPAQVRSRRFALLGAVAGTAFLAGWIVLLGAVAMGSASFDVALDPWIRLIQCIGLLCVPATAVAIWNAWVTCRNRRHWAAKAWSVLLALALADLAWFSFSFGLISTSLNY